MTGVLGSKLRREHVTVNYTPGFTGTCPISTHILLSFQDPGHHGAFSPTPILKIKESHDIPGAVLGLQEFP